MAKNAYPPEIIPIDQFVSRCFTKASAMLSRELLKEPVDPAKAQLINEFEGILVDTFREMTEEARAKMMQSDKGAPAKKK